MNFNWASNLFYKCKHQEMYIFFVDGYLMLLQTMRNITKRFYSRQFYLSYEDSRLTALS